MVTEQVFRQTCVVRRAATSLSSDGSRLEEIGMEDKRQTNSQQVPARIGPPPLIVSSKSQLIVHCDNNSLQSATASQDVSIFDVV